MLKTRPVFTLAAGLAMLTGACFLGAAPQTIADAPGVSVDTQGARLLHRAKVDYPREVRTQVEGTVLAQVKLDTDGNVIDATILSGPDALRKPVLQSVLSWHFTKDLAGSTRQISVTFRSPEPVAAAVPQATVPSLRAPALTREAPGALGSAPSEVTIEAIQIAGLGISDDEFLAQLPPVHLKQPMSQEDFAKINQAVRQLDPHLVISTSAKPEAPYAITVRISAPNVADVAAATGFPGAIQVGGMVQSQKLISHPSPVYPDLAKSARIQGTVQFSALIGPDGRMKELKVISGHPLLRQAALDAVKQWTYQPTLLNGNPVAVSTTIDVVFTLNP